MSDDIDKEFSHVIIETLKAVLSPDKVLIDQAQLQLKVLQVRQGWSLNFDFIHKFKFGLEF